MTLTISPIESVVGSFNHFRRPHSPKSFTFHAPSLTIQSPTMTKPHLVHRRSREERRQLLQPHSPHRVGEVVGGTTAEVAAVCCCFPIALVDLMFLTMYKLPAGLCKNAMRKRRRRRSKIQYNGGGDCGGKDCSVEDDPTVAMAVVERFVSLEADKELLEFENEMWEKFSESGFWRNPSEDARDSTVSEMTLTSTSFRK